MTATSPALARAERRFRIGRRVLVILAGLVVVATLVLTSIGTVVLLQNSEKAKQDRMVSSTALRVLVECTTDPANRVPPEPDPPAGDCFVRNQKASAAIVGDPPAPINNVVILAAACADRAGVDTEAEIRDCVLRGLRR